uniref:DNA-directed DNA polymerase family A palm domain-containing protein n=1 Tax=Boodleopsis sp. FL1161 TaxID=2364084 RepID=A0A386AZ84_9CHLO|nr:hypothetical protein [Boodleopsis sp. FL1161]
MRNDMKPVNFNMVYGIGAPNLWNRFLSQGKNISFTEVQNLHSTWKKTFPQIETYQVKCNNFFNSNYAPLKILGDTKYITSLKGRIRRPQISRTTQDQSFLNFTQIINYPIQATCTDFLKSTLLQIYYAIKRDNLPATIVLSAHDEIILECSPLDVGQV